MGINYRLSGTTNCFESVNGIFSDLLLTDKKSFCTQSDVYGQSSTFCNKEEYETMFCHYS